MISIHSDRSWDFFSVLWLQLFWDPPGYHPTILVWVVQLFPFRLVLHLRTMLGIPSFSILITRPTHSRLLRLTSVTMSLFWYKLFEFFFCSNTPDYSVTTFLGILFSKLSKTVVAHSDRVQVSLPCATRLLFRLFDNVISSEEVIILSAQDTTICWHQLCANVAIGCFLSSAEENTPADTVLCTRVSRRSTLWLPPAFEPITDTNSLAV